MEDNINLKIRSQVLEFSLQIESFINGLLLSYLGISDKERTKNFGTKAGISFKSKIDLLYDINVLTKDEHFDLELLMIFRNKFLHDLESNSFSYILSKLDNGIVNKFKKFINSESSIQNELEYEKAYSNLFWHNMKIIREKLRERRKSIEKRGKFLEGFYDSFLELSSMSSDFAQQVCLILENSEITNKKTLSLFKTFSEVVKKFCHDFGENGEKNKQILEDYHKMITAGKNLY